MNNNRIFGRLIEIVSSEFAIRSIEFGNGSESRQDDLSTSNITIVAKAGLVDYEFECTYHGKLVNIKKLFKHETKTDIVNFDHIFRLTRINETINSEYHDLINTKYNSPTE